MPMISTGNQGFANLKVEKCYLCRVKIQNKVGNLQKWGCFSEREQAGCWKLREKCGTGDQGCKI